VVEFLEMKSLNQYISRYFGVILLLSAGAGLILPVGQHDTSLIIVVSLASVIFSSFFRVKLDRSLFTSDWRDISIYFAIRFVLLPVLLYFAVSPFNSFYALVFFLLMLLPSAVSSPAFSAMNEGSVPLALKVLMFTNFATIVTIPLLSRFVMSKQLQLNSVHIFLIMVYTVIVPFIVYFPLREIKSVRSVFADNNPLITAIGLMVIFVFSTARNRDLILGNPSMVLLYAAISICFFMILYFVGYYLLPKTRIANRIAYSVCSGANNIGMGVSLTMLFFPGQINIFFIIAQLAWIFVLIPMRYFYKWEMGKTSNYK
jgi:predicted Na+-dependent transporter